MSNSSTDSWSDNPNAPKIPRSLHLVEKSDFAGNVSTILYGIIVVLFFQCMGALFSRMNPVKGCVKWVFVAHTLAMFLLATGYVVANFFLQIGSLIDNREFPGIGDLFPPGPLGYQNLTYTEAVSVCPRVFFFMNNILADGLLLYRCHVIYSRNYWVTAFPTLVYLTSIAMGIGFIYETSLPDGILWNVTQIMDFGISWFSISVSLNILLTLMIVARLILYGKRCQQTTGHTRGISGLYKPIATILIESCALYAANSLIFIVTFGANNSTSDAFLATLAMMQVIAPFLVIQRIANRRALGNDSNTREDFSTIGFEQQEETSSRDRTFLGDSVNSTNTTYGETPCERDGNP